MPEALTLKVSDSIILHVVFMPQGYLICGNHEPETYVPNVKGVIDSVTRLLGHALSARRKEELEEEKRAEEAMQKIGK